MIFMSDKLKVTRFSVSLPPSLVETFDYAWKNMKYDNRSKAVHDAIRSFITESEWAHQKDAFMAGAVLILYYLDKPGLLEEIAKLQHAFDKLISSTLHIHLEKNKCLEIIVVRGKVQEVRAFAQMLMAKKGVKQVKVAVMAS